MLLKNGAKTTVQVGVSSGVAASGQLDKVKLDDKKKEKEEEEKK